MPKTPMSNKLTIGIIAFLVVVGAIYLALTGHFKKSSSGQNLDTNKLQVATSFYPLYFFSNQIGIEKSQIINITPAGSEPHDYDPSTGDIAKISKSKMLVLNGGVEAWGDKTRENLKGKKVLIVVAGEGLLNRQLTEDGQTSIDPHVWLDPQLAKKEADKITQGFIKIDSANNSYYVSNEKMLDDKLDQLDNSYKQGLANCKQKDIITSHAAFGYLAARYGLNQVPIAGLSPDAEPSSQQLADVAKFAKEHNVKYIFFESLVSPKLSETIASEVGAKTLVLDPLEGLSDDDTTQGKDYFTVMQSNLKNLQTALECSSQITPTAS